jgi:hypothetical protein
MAVTLAVLVGIQVLVPAVIRPNLLPSTTVTFPVNKTAARHAVGVLYQRGRLRDLLRRPAHTAGRVGAIRPADGGLIRPPPIGHAAGTTAQRERPASDAALPRVSRILLAK